jgi:hypothetical protein
VRFNAQSSGTTHGAPEAVECCELLGTIVGRCIPARWMEKLHMREQIIQMAGDLYSVAARGRV